MSVLWQVCGNCEGRPGRVFCPQDCAVLCDVCDSTVHAAGSLAHRHARVKLEPSRPAIFSSCTPEERGRMDELCDVCKDATAFVFCRPERAVLCFACDTERHKGGEGADGDAKSHARFFLPGVRVGKEIQGASASTDVVSGTSSRGAEEPATSDGAGNREQPGENLRRSGRKRRSPGRPPSPSEEGEGIASVGSQPTLEVGGFNAPGSPGCSEDWLDMTEDRKVLGMSRLVTQS